jgi:hypothetical protein
MALYDDKEKYIFFHLYKCGGKSLRTILDAHSLKVRGCKTDFEKEKAKKEDITFGEIHGVHCQPFDVKHHYDKNKSLELFNEMYKFTIVRNPFAFLLSTFFYARKHKSHFMHPVAISIPFKDFPAYYQKTLVQHATSRPYGANRVTSLYNWVMDKDGNNIMDFVGKLENINEDSKIIMDKLGIPHVPVPVVDKNQLNNKPYREVYDNTTRRFVEDKFARDFEYFGYEF